MVFLNGKVDVTHKFQHSNKEDKQVPHAARLVDFFFGGRSDNDSNWEGRLDEIAVFNRVLSPDEIQTLAGD